MEKDKNVMLNTNYLVAERKLKMEKSLITNHYIFYLWSNICTHRLLFARHWLSTSCWGTL